MQARNFAEENASYREELEGLIQREKAVSEQLVLARRGLEATMGRLRVNAGKLTQGFLRDYKDFGTDCVVFPASVGCKHVWGWLSLLREVCREQNIPICAFDLDWMDSRARPIDSIRATIEEFFATVMQ